MARSFDYAIIQAVPDPRRGERVNIGIAAFGSDDLDVRIFETRKLTAITARSWDADIKAFAEMLKNLDDTSLLAKDRISQLKSVEGVFALSAAGWFEADTADQFETAMKEITKSLVTKPKRARRGESSSVISEISSELRKAKVLAGKDDELSSGLVFRSYPIASGLEADFAQQNSQFHIAAVLDLRANNPQLAQAALKGVVLDQANERFENVHRVGIYSAAKERLPELRDNLAILRPYADDIYNWEDQHDRENATRVFSDAYAAHHSDPPRFI